MIKKKVLQNIIVKINRSIHVKSSYSLSDKIYNFLVI